MDKQQEVNDIMNFIFTPAFHKLITEFQKKYPKCREDKSIELLTTLRKIKKDKSSPETITFLCWMLGYAMCENTTVVKMDFQGDPISFIKKLKEREDDRK